MSGPSGRTQLPVLRLSTGDTFRMSAAIAPARSPKRRAVRRYIIHVVPANRRMKGKRINAPFMLPESAPITPGIQKRGGVTTK